MSIEAAAKSWIGTPFFPHGYIKGHGCSCQTLVTAIYSEAGILPENFRVPEGPLDWSLAQTESLIEKFVDDHLRDYFVSVDGPPQAGDLLGFKVGGCIHHLGICLGVEFVHCLRHSGVILNRLDDATYLQRLQRIWRPRILL